MSRSNSEAAHVPSQDIDTAVQSAADGTESTSILASSNSDSGKSSLSMTEDDGRDGLNFDTSSSQEKTATVAGNDSGDDVSITDFHQEEATMVGGRSELQHQHPQQHQQYYLPRSTDEEGIKGGSEGTLSHNSSSSNNNNNTPRGANTSLRPPPQSPSRTTPDPTPFTTTPLAATGSSCLHSNVDRFQLLRHNCGMIVNDNRVQLFIVSLIALNAIMMGIGTFDFVTENKNVDDVFETVDKIFLIIFTIELGMQCIYHGWRLFLDGWLVFDFIIILVSWSFAAVSIVRAFRIFRALRLITRIKVMKNLILALFGVMPRMLAISLLLLLVSYIFAVMFTQLFKDLFERGVTSIDYFGRMDDTFFTLFQIMTLDAWAEICREVMHVYPWAWLPFVIFVVVTGFVVVNLIIAVICDAISALHDDEKAKLHGTYDLDGEDDSLADSGHPALRQDIREQLDTLEDQVEELTKMQQETIAALEALTVFVTAQKQRQREEAVVKNEGGDTYKEAPEPSTKGK